MEENDDIFEDDEKEEEDEGETKSTTPLGKSKYEIVTIQRYQDLIKNLFSNYIQDDGFICGGFARVCLEEKDFKECQDIDIYCKNVEAFERIRKRLLAESLHIESRTSDIAISFKCAFTGKYPIQLIKPLNQGYVHTSDENIEEVLNNFDFTIVRAGIYLLNDELKAICDENFFKDKNKLVIKNIHCPIAEVYRIAKYVNKGFTISTLEVVKVLQDWENRPEKYKIDILETLKKTNPSQKEIDEMESYYI